MGTDSIGASCQLLVSATDSKADESNNFNVRLDRQSGIRPDIFFLSSSDTKSKNTGSSCLTVDLKDRIEGKRGDEREMWMERKRYKKNGGEG